MAFQAGAIVSKLTLDKSKFSAAITGVKKETATMGGWVKQNSAQFKKMGLAITAMGTAALFTFKKMVDKYVEVGDMIDKMAKRTGFAATTLSELAYAADISGADISSLEKGVKRMAKTISDAGRGMATYMDAFKAIGLEVKDLMGLNPEGQFMKIGLAIAELEDPTLRAAAAQDIFGRAGTMLLPLFAEGVEGMASLREEAHRLGIVFDEEAAAKAAALKDAQTALKKSLQGLSFAIVSEFIPVLTTMAEHFTDVFVNVRGNAKTFTEGILTFLKTIAFGIQGLMLAWHEFQRMVFEGAALVTKHLRDQVGTLVKALCILDNLPIVGKAINIVTKKMADLWFDLNYITEGYNKTADETGEKMADIIEGFEKFFAMIEKVRDGMKGMKTETKGVSETLVNTMLPAAGKVNEIITAAGNLWMFWTNNLYEGKKKIIEITEQEMAVVWEMSDLYRMALESLMDTFSNWVKEGGDLMERLGGFFVDLGETLAATAKQMVIESLRLAAQEILAEKAKSIAKIITKVIEAIPFPLNIAAIGIAIGLVTKFFSGLSGGFKGRALGGPVEAGEPYKVGERGPELFVPERSGEIVPLRGTAGRIVHQEIHISPVFQTDAVDEYSVKRFMENKGAPALLEMLKNGVLLPEFQKILGIR